MFVSVDVGRRQLCDDEVRRFGGAEGLCVHSSSVTSSQFKHLCWTEVDSTQNFVTSGEDQ